MTGPQQQNSIAELSCTENNHSSMLKPLEDPLVWIDCEMTGLNLNKDFIIEIACIITDSKLTTLIEGPNLIVHQSSTVMDGMNDWCKEHHGVSGLTAAVLSSTLDMQAAEDAVLTFVKEYVPLERTGVLAGNSVHADQRFLEKDMPRLAKHLHYRIVDVSTIKELARRWYSEKHFTSLPVKNYSHRALDDIRESIKELKWYKENVFVSDTL